MTPTEKLKAYDSILFETFCEMKGYIPDSNDSQNGYGRAVTDEARRRFEETYGEPLNGSK